MTPSRRLLSPPSLWRLMRAPSWPNQGDRNGTPRGAPAPAFCTTRSAGGARPGARTRSRQGKVPPGSSADTSRACADRRQNLRRPSMDVHRQKKHHGLEGRGDMPHAHAQPASTRRGGEARRGDDATGSESWRAAAATARRTTVDGSKSRQTAADGDTMAGTVGGRGEKTRVVHPLSKRSHSKGVKQ